MMLPFSSKPKTVARSPIHGDIAIGTTYGKKTLFAGGVSHSGGEYIAMWRKSIDRISSDDAWRTHSLVLGVGGGTAIGMLRKKFPAMHITGVDIDPIMIRIAREHFGLVQHDLLKLVTGDAVRFIARKKTGKQQSSLSRKRKTGRAGPFGLIIVDLFIGELNPARSRTLQFLTGLKRALLPGGSILYNCHVRRGHPEEFGQFLKLCTSVFPFTDRVFAYPKNTVLHFRTDPHVP